MNEFDVRLGGFDRQEFWNEHYNTPEGKQKVDLRQTYYWCVEPGEYPTDYDAEVIQAAYMAGLDTNATIVDIGCSFPKFLELWQETGHTGRLIGVEPNYRQFNDLPYWKPLKAAQKVIELMDATEPAQNGELYVADWGKSKVIEGVELFHTDAGNLPVADKSVDLATAMWCLYQIDEESQVPALNHIASKLKPEGMFAATLSGAQNKPAFIRLTEKLAHFMSELNQTTILPPPPLQDGFTSEKAAQVLPSIFSYVYTKHIRQPLIVHDTLSMTFMFNALLSLADRFVDDTGNPIAEQVLRDHVLMYFREVLGPQIREGKFFHDQTDRTIFFCSQQPLNLAERTHGDTQPFTELWLG